MASRRGPVRFALALAWRAALVGALIPLAGWVAFTHQLYATALVLASLAALVIGDIARLTLATDRQLSQFVDGLFAEGAERPAGSEAGLKNLDGSFARALDQLGQARSARQRELDYLRTLSDTVAAALLVIDDKGTVELANHAARMMLPPLVKLDDLGDAAAGRLSAMRPGSGEVVRLSDGRAVFAMATAFSTPEGGMRRLISLQRVTGDLDAVELRAWSDLVRVLSHEIMNSLTPICALAESSAALIGDDNSEAAAALEIIARRSAGLMIFVERYRAIFDVPPPRRVRISLGECLGRIDALMASQMDKAGVAYACRTETPHVILDIDPDLMDQAIINLLKNALEAVRETPASRVNLVGRLEAGQAVIEVTDNGPGVAAEDLESIFIPFFSRKTGSSGVGLSLSRQIAIAHGGGIKHTPVPGGGARFAMVLRTSEAAGQGPARR